MKIGYDAKRLFFNGSGLGNYSRSLVQSMARFFPQDEYVLFSPKGGNPCGFAVPQGVETVGPTGIVDRALPSAWRSLWMGKTIRRQGIDLFHGLSAELPADIRRSGARSVVTQHDLIFVRLPELFKPADRLLYTRKYRAACFAADRVIAISEQTRGDLIELWNVPGEKIDVVYHGCNPIFYEPASDGQKAAVRQKYNLPERYLLSVGTIEARKNLLLTVRAMARGRLDIDLVACGRPTPYVETIMTYARRHGIDHRLHFLHGVGLSELPAIYRQAEALVYVSLYEGFGIPILEGFESGIPVITSRGGVFPETGGDAAAYVDPNNVGEMIEVLRKILNDSDLRNDMIRRGIAWARRFREEAVAVGVEAVYDRLR